MGSKIQKTIEINAKVKASLEGMEKTVSDLEKGLEKQKFDLNKNSGLSKLIKDYKEAKAELDELMSGDTIARTDIKKAEQLGGKVSKLYKQIGKSFEDLRAGSDDTFRKLFPDSFTAKISKGTKAIENFFSKLDSKSVKEGRLDEARKDLTRLNDELDGLKSRRLKVEVEVDRKNVKDELDRINKDLEQMRENFKKKLIPEEKKDAQGRTQTDRLNSSVSTWSSKLAQDIDARKNLKVQSLSKSQSSQISKLEGQLIDPRGVNLADAEKKRLDALYAEQTKRATIAKTPGARDTSRNRREYGGVTDKELAAQIAASEKELQRLRAIADKIDDIKQQPQRAYDAAVKKLETQIKTDRTNLEKAEKALEAHTTQRENQEAAASQKADDFMAGKQVAEATQTEIDALKALNDEKQKNLDLEKKLKDEKSFDSQKTKDSAIAKKDSSIEKKKLEIQELENAIKNLANDTDFDAIFKKLQELGVNTDGIDKTRAGLEGIKTDLESLDENTLKEIREALEQLGVDAKDTDAKVDVLTQGMEQLGDTDKELKRTENEMENLKNQVLQFFSLTNSVQLFKRAVTSALNTVKELDATMTEAAVVTEFDVGDMWDKLPEYSAEAQKLGVSINGMYQATTLYYQQGLKSNKAMALGVETMKMAKIAGLEAADATKAMTAALRGFNMELDEASATRVNDVYSQLAAVTAADVSQISTAMEKTASIAANANMEFETTAALLAQIIETTQEAPETAGTAMKTIIARFSEVKNLRNAGKTSGKDEEGEDIDVNKIQTALKSVGISMDEYFAGTEGLDQVLLRLAEKWKGLDFETQRYIATMAAGSRQQSRFIAMMSDYGRTTELVGEAQNSAGASQKQYEKTLDSMEIKLQKLQNAWNEFLMGLANNEVLKFAVDGLTFIVEGLNNIIDAISGGNGLIKALTSLMGVIGALKLGKAIFSGTAAGGLLGGFLNKGSTTTTTTETRPDGSVIKTITKSSEKEAEQTGYRDGQGYKAGWNRALNAEKGEKFKSFWKGGKSLSAMDAENGKISKRKKKKWESDANKGLQEKYTARGNELVSSNKTKKGRTDALRGMKEDYLKEIKELNPEFTEEQMKKVGDAYHNAKVDLNHYEQGVSAANQEVLKMNGTLMTQEEYQQKVAAQTQKTSFNYGALGQTLMGVGVALGLLSSLFESMGWEEGAEAVATISTVFMGLGAVLTTLPSLISGVAAVATAAGISVQAAWWWVVIIVALLASFIAAIVHFNKVAQENKLENRMKKAAKATEEAKKAAEEAKNEYEALLSEKTDYSELQDALKNLVIGTHEWKEALLEANSQVIELLTTYPELAKHLERGAQGQLSISQEGWNELSEQKREEVQGANMMLLRRQMNEQELNKEAGTVKLKKHLFYTVNRDSETGNAIQKERIYDTGNDFSEFERETYNSLLEAYKKYGADLFKTTEGYDPNAITNEATVFHEALQEIAGSSAHTAEEFYLLKNEIMSAGAAVDKAELEMEALGEAMITAGLSAASLSQEYSQEIANAFGERVKSNASKSAAKEYSKDLIDEGFSGKKSNGSNIDQMMKDLGILGLKTEDTTKNLELIYEELAGPIPEGLKGNAEGLAAAIGELKTDMDYSKAADQLIMDMQVLNGDLQRQFSAVVSGEGTSLTIGDMKNVENGVTILENAAKGMGKTLDELAKDFQYTDTAYSQLTADQKKQYQTHWYNNLSDEEKKKYQTEGGGADYEKIAQALENTTVAAIDILKVDAQLKTKELQQQAEGIYTNANSLVSGSQVQGAMAQMTNLNKMSIEQATSLADRMAEIEIQGGDTTKFSSLLSSITSQLSGKDLSTALELISKTDWTDSDSIESTITALKGLGANISDTFMDDVLDATNTIKKVDFQSLEDKFSRLGDAISLLEEKIDSSTNTFSKEERQKLVEQGASEASFIRTGTDSYVYLGDITSLLQQINSNVGTIAEESVQALQDRVDRGRMFDTAYASNKGVLNEKSISTQSAIEGLVSGRFGVAGGTGGTDFDFSEAQIQDLAKQVGVNTAGLTAEGVRKAIINAYEEVYGSGGGIYKSNVQALHQEGKEMSQIAAYQKVGTSDLSLTIDEQEQKVAEFENYVNARGETILESLDWFDAEGWLEGKNSVGDVLRGVLDGEIGDADAQAVLAQQLGMDNALWSTTDQTEILAFLSEVYDKYYAGTEAVDAYIQSYAGLDLRVKETTQRLTKENAALKNSEGTIKNHIAGVNKMERAVDKLNEALEAEAENLNSVNENVANAAAEKIGTQTKQVFGEHFDAEMVKEHKDLFVELAKGGAAAEQAWQKLTQISLDKIMQINNLSPEVQQEVQGVYDYLMAQDLKVGIDTEVTGLDIAKESWDSYINYMAAAGIKMTPVISTDENGNEVITWLASRIDNSGFSGYSGSNGGGGSSNKWENSYDKLHNVLEQINDTIRQREKLERRYQSLLDRQLLTLQEARNLYNQTLDTYQNEAGYQRRVISERYQQIEDEIAANPGMEKYVQVVDDGNGGKTIRIDWEAFENKDNTEWKNGEKVDEFYDSIKGWLEDIYGAEETLNDIADAIWEKINEGKDSYLDLEDKIITALVDAQQKEIDALSEVNDSINDTNSRILDSLQEQIDSYRQERDNAEAEEEISDKQRRLAYLQQDTSGANAVEILNLQKEIEEAQEDYTDTLIDQKISELQDQNDAAAEQRQQQIDIMQAQLEYAQETGAFNERATQMIDEVIANGGIIHGTDLETLLKDSENWSGMTELGQMNWLDELTTLVAEAVGYRDRQSSIKDLIDAEKVKTGDKINFTTADGKTVTGTVQKDGTIKDEATGQVYSNVTRDWLGNYSTTENYQTAPPPGSEPPASEPEPPKVTTNDKKGVSAAIWNGGQGWGNGATRVSRLKEVFGEGNDIQKNYVDKRVMSGYTGKVSDYSYDKMKKKFVAYKTGGLADFTGPAWLDGTKSKPEYILNADQTKAFFQLIDVLGSLQAKPAQTTQNNGDNTYDIDINVESIGSDYDVEQLADTVKRLINEDGRYRNNNTVGGLR